MSNKHSKAQHIPQRTCSICKFKKELKSLYAFILIPEGIIIDPQRKLPHHRLYVCRDINCLSKLEEWGKHYYKKYYGIQKNWSELDLQSNRSVQGVNNEQ
ncbi:MAG: DUF448 domain-containing protein [Candidatus Cloacimonadaceae bacterium]|jgi:predicted RNA-binding protein YlxR (DUF448 family)|nr:DUF448 domain-containing protein [Candidatus Cloacimonadota bacterium]MCB5257926.1 DUF448 domain-containing protein [Candidatus Cloacimonadota bacterium]MDD5624561.1 DUF448 domain-containing protein [Candidatus Cloacimonadota bacterium]MDY0111649.1 DUF448 domain-containing protein [Candidatus Syntrophosphaera sp.]